MLEITLTPSKYLNDNQQYKRRQLFNEELINPKLELIHNKFNSHDKLALEIFCDKIMIGYIQKYNSENDINNYCFTNSELLNDIKVLFINNKLIIHKKSNLNQNNEEFDVMNYIDNSTGKMSDIWYEIPGPNTPW